MSEEKWRYASRPRPFWPWLLGFALVLCAVGAAGLAVLWGALERYEAATPEAAILRSRRKVDLALPLAATSVMAIRALKASS